MTLPALSLWQPYASLIAIEAKLCETRSWPPPEYLIGQRIAIHAALRPIHKGDPFYVAGRLRMHIEQALDIRAPLWNTALPRGAIVATAVLTGAYRSGGYVEGQEFVRLVEKIPGSPMLGGVHMGYPGILFGDHSNGRWLWRLSKIEALERPVPAKGKQGLWPWDPDGERVAA